MPPSRSANLCGTSVSPAYRLYGLILASSYPFVTPLPVASGPPDVTFTCVAASPRPVPWSLRPMSSPSASDTDEPAFALHRLDDCDVMHFAGLADFFLWPDRIVCHLFDPTYSYMVELLLIGVVLAHWLEGRGMIALHASTVVAEDRAIAFAAHRESGKTSLAISFLKAGDALLADDFLALQPVNGQLVAHPGYPQMRLWPEQAERFGLDPTQLSLVMPDKPKRRVPTTSLGAFCDQPYPLAAIYLPERYTPSRDDPTELSVYIEPLSQAEAVFTLITHVFSRVLVNRIADQQGRLARFAPLVSRLPVRRLRYPSGLSHLPRVREAILADVAAL